jgi:hypothetical protein
MSETPKDKDQEKGDEVLRRLLKTPPDPRTGRPAKDSKDSESEDEDRDE